MRINIPGYDPLPWLSRVHSPIARAGRSTDIRHTCEVFNLTPCAITWTCPDYLSIVAIDESWVSFRISDGWYDRIDECEASDALVNLLYDVYTVGAPDTFRYTRTASCYNVDLRRTTDCIACTLLAHASQTRRRRHKTTSEKKAARRKALEALPICKA